MASTESNKLGWSDKILNTLILPIFPQTVQPNYITLVRFILTPFVIYLLHANQWTAGIILFFLTASTDALDGSLARTRGLITEWGKIYDPVADKLLIGLTALMIIPKFFDFMLVFLIILSEVVIIIGAYWAKYTKENIEISANIWGKLKMIIQSVSIFILIFAMIVTTPEWLLRSVELALYSSVGLAVISFVHAGL